MSDETRLAAIRELAKQASVSLEKLIQATTMQQALDAGSEMYPKFSQMADIIEQGQVEEFAAFALLSEVDRELN